jgi:lipopolysaccharide/colanic/teichoic acid biosynthesis glycosyltransferase
MAEGSAPDDLGLADRSRADASRARLLTARRFDYKRFVDLGLALTALLFLAPLLLLVALAVAGTSRGPVLFRQTRIGQGERPFTMLKFRTMHVDADHRLQEEMNRRELAGEAVAEDGLFKPANDPRITAVGRFLRQSSIDELPQLINVVRGEMSMVGPRPALPWEVELFSPEERRRHDCRPGITGVWQVSGRNRLSMRKMLALDLVYVRYRSLRLDLWVLMQTPKAVLFERATR